MPSIVEKLKAYRAYLIAALVAAAGYIAYALDLLGGSTPTP